jgi:hypothetical protein
LLFWLLYENGSDPAMVLDTVGNLLEVIGRFFAGFCIKL